jgi:lipopolysaccharide transport system ATP-binding protein
MSVIRFDGVSKSFPQYQRVFAGLKASLLHLPGTLRSFRKPPFLALDNLSFAVDKGETVGIVGQNGSGKSTALALIAGILQPQQGTVEVHGRIAPLIELGAGFHPDLSGRDNIILNAILLGLTRREVMDRMDAIVAFSELEEFLDQPIRTYSSGMIARLGFSVAVSLDHDILLIDEVFAVGDLGFKTKCYERINRLKRQGSTIILVTHSPDEARLLCHRVLWLDRGRLLADGETNRIVNQYERTAVDPAARSGERHLPSLDTFVVR